MTDDQPDIPDSYAGLVALLIDSNSGTVMDNRPRVPRPRPYRPARLDARGRGDRVLPKE
jgi:hypothetical protein